MEGALSRRAWLSACQRQCRAGWSHPGNAGWSTTRSRSGGGSIKSQRQCNESVFFPPVVNFFAPFAIFNAISLQIAGRACDDIRVISDMYRRSRDLSGKSLTLQRGFNNHIVLMSYPFVDHTRGSANPRLHCICTTTFCLNAPSHLASTSRSTV